MRRSHAGLRGRHEGFDPSLRRLGRVRARFLGIDWVTPPWRSDPRKCCNFRRNDPQLEYRAGPCLGCGWGDTWKHHRLLDRRPVRISFAASLWLLRRTNRIKIARYLFRRQGVVVVLIARFVAVLRSVVASSRGYMTDICRSGFAHRPFPGADHELRSAFRPHNDIRAIR
jgi:hypothetical protein